jgi:hypothetical protein
MMNRLIQMSSPVKCRLCWSWNWLHVVGVANLQWKLFDISACVGYCCGCAAKLAPQSDHYKRLMFFLHFFFTDLLTNCWFIGHHSLCIGSSNRRDLMFIWHELIEGHFKGTYISSKVYLGHHRMVINYRKLKVWSLTAVNHHRRPIRSTGRVEISGSDAQSHHA